MIKFLLNPVSPCVKLSKLYSKVRSYQLTPNKGSCRRWEACSTSECPTSSSFVHSWHPWHLPSTLCANKRLHWLHNLFVVHRSFTQNLDGWTSNFLARTNRCTPPAGLQLIDALGSTNCLVNDCPSFLFFSLWPWLHGWNHGLIGRACWEWREGGMCLYWVACGAGTCWCSPIWGRGRGWAEEETEGVGCGDGMAVSCEIGNFGWSE